MTNSPDAPDDPVRFTLHHAKVRPAERDTLLRLIDLGFSFRHVDTFTGWSRTVLARDYVAQMIRVSEPYRQFVDGKDGPVFSVLGYLSLRDGVVVSITASLETTHFEPVAWLLSHYLQPSAELRRVRPSTEAPGAGVRLVAPGAVAPLP